MELGIGIDFGTTSSCVAAIRDDMVVIIKDEQGYDTYPSVVHFGKKGQVLIGRSASERIIDDPENTIHSIKRVLGRTFNDPVIQVAKSAYFYEIFKGPKSCPMIRARGETYSPAQVSAALLRGLCKRAERFFDEKVRRAVITVPANAGHAQREAIQLAARLAGFKVVRLLNEPTAAALAYALLGVQGKTVLVYDFGGGTFDCSVIRWNKKKATVLASHGDRYLGGDDIDIKLARRVAHDFQKDTGVDIRGQVKDWKRFLTVCEKSKRELSDRLAVPVRLESLAYQKNDEALALEYGFLRDELERLSGEFVRNSLDIVHETLRMAKVSVSDIDKILMIGGTSRMPMVQEAVHSEFGKTPFVDIDPYSAVAIGAAIEAFRSAGGKSPLVDQAPVELVEVSGHSFGLGYSSGDFDPVIEKNSTLPASGWRCFTTKRDNQRELKFTIQQGESKNSAKNIELGVFSVSNLPKQPAGDVKVEVLFEVGHDGILHVSARELQGNKVHQFHIPIADVSD